MGLKDISQWIEEKSKEIVLGLMALIVLLLVIVLWLSVQKEPKDVVPATDIYEELLADEAEKVDDANATEDIDLEENPAPETVVVDVKGAVQAPGVYTMTVNSRIVDAIAQAGGITEAAEQNAVNLAQIVEDQMVIYVPELGEEEVNLAHLTQEISGTEENSVKTVNINTAEKEALMTLNGIGSSKADSILSYREENGNFQTIEEIKNVSGIGEATFENLKEVITVAP